MTFTANQGLFVPASSANANVPADLTTMLTGAGYGVENHLVQRFLSIVDRTARNPTPNEGELSYLTDLNKYQYYDGAAWVDLAKGFVGTTSRIVNSASFTTVEIVLDQITFTAVAGLRYKLTAQTSMESSVANDTALMRFRWTTGATLTTAGTQFNIAQVGIPTANRAVIPALHETVTGITAGTISIGITAVRGTGSGTLLSAGSVNMRDIITLEIV